MPVSIPGLRANILIQRSDTMEQTKHEAETDTDMTLLVHEHRLLDERVHELAVQEHLTPEESLELDRLKKEKLKLKDMISQLSDRRESA